LVPLAWSSGPISLGHQGSSIGLLPAMAAPASNNGASADAAISFLKAILRRSSQVFVGNRRLQQRAREN
jgi:hypothetical protein